MNIFDFNDNRIVSIGRDLWDKIGGLGCYDKLLEIAEQVGKESKDKISKIKQ